MSEDDASDEDDVSMSMAMDLYETLVITVPLSYCVIVRSCSVVNPRMM